jgi:hypothetical protein
VLPDSRHSEPSPCPGLVDLASVKEQAAHGLARAREHPARVFPDRRDGNRLVHIGHHVGQRGDGDRNGGARLPQAAQVQRADLRREQGHPCDCFHNENRVRARASNVGWWCSYLSAIRVVDHAEQIAAVDRNEPDDVITLKAAVVRLVSSNIKPHGCIHNLERRPRVAARDEGRERRAGGNSKHRRSEFRPGPARPFRVLHGAAKQSVGVCEHRGKQVGVSGTGLGIRGEPQGHRGSKAREDRRAAFPRRRLWRCCRRARIRQVAHNVLDEAMHPDDVLLANFGRDSDERESLERAKHGDVRLGVCRARCDSHQPRARAKQALRNVFGVEQRAGAHDAPGARISLDRALKRKPHNPVKRGSAFCRSAFAEHLQIRSRGDTRVDDKVACLDEGEREIVERLRQRLQLLVTIVLDLTSQQREALCASHRVDTHDPFLIPRDTAPCRDKGVPDARAARAGRRCAAVCGIEHGIEHGKGQQGLDGARVRAPSALSNTSSQRSACSSSAV